MKKIYVFLMLAFMSLSFVNCTSTSNGQNDGQIVVQSSQPNIGENLNLQAVGEVVKSSRNPQEIEQKLNADNGINNLDLDGDGNRDYLKVTEYGQGTEHGYSICAVLKDGEPEVTNVIVNTSTNQMSLNGNPEYYGNNNNYQSSFNTTDFLLLAWMMQPRYSYYHSPYGYGHYGYGYSYGRPVVPYHSYYSRPFVKTSVTRTYNVPKTRTTHSIKSPNSNNKSSVATKRISNFANANKSQKAFKVGDSNKSYKGSTGFGNKSNSNSNSNSYKSSPSKSSSSSYKSSPSKSSSSSYKPSSRPSSSSSRSSSSRSSISRRK